MKNAHGIFFYGTGNILNIISSNFSDITSKSEFPLIETDLGSTIKYDDDDDDNNNNNN